LIYINTVVDFPHTLYYLFYYFKGIYIMSDIKARLAALTAAHTTKSSTPTNPNTDFKLFYPFWKMEVDQIATIRFLPDGTEDGENNLGFLVKKQFHELFINGKKKTVSCLEPHGEKCPICELSRKHYTAEGKTSKIGAQLYRKISYIGQCIVVESPIEHDQSQLVKLIDIGPKIYEQIQAGFRSGDMEASPDDFKQGYNFKIRKSMQKTAAGDFANYSTSSFSYKPVALSDEVIENVTLFNLKEHTGRKPDLAYVEALLVAFQTGGSVDMSNVNNDSANDSNDSASHTHTETVTEHKAEAKTEKVEVKEEKVEATGGSTADVLARMRQRSAALANKE
jgi:hypothetical protein